MLKSEDQKIRKYAKKLKCINYLGGCCKICNESNLFKLTFHHKDPNEKEFSFSDRINSRWSTLKIELDKCDLLCANCHRELHYELSVIKNKDRRVNKLIYLEHSGSKCCKCGYNKCPSSLTFHHRDKDSKIFSIGNLGKKLNTIDDLDKFIISEIDKCDLLCANCHVIEHIDIDLYNKNIDLIIKKSENIKEIQIKINREEVYKMLDSGMKQKDIAKYFKASNGTISDIKRCRKK